MLSEIDFGAFAREVGPRQEPKNTKRKMVWWWLCVDGCEWMCVVLVCVLVPFVSLFPSHVFFFPSWLSFLSRPCFFCPVAFFCPATGRTAVHSSGWPPAFERTVPCIRAYSPLLCIRANSPLERTAVCTRAHDTALERTALHSSARPSARSCLKRTIRAEINTVTNIKLIPKQ